MTAALDEPDAEAPPEQPVELTAAQKLEHEHYEHIKQLAAEVRGARVEWAAAKDRAKAKKAAFDELNGELIATINRGPDPQIKLPLDGGCEEHGDADDWWRSISVDQLDITPGLVTKLAEHGIETLGQLQDYWQQGRGLTDLDGIGEVKAAAVADAFSVYGAAHPEIFGPVQGELSAVCDDEDDEDDDEEEL